jgi:N-methylhydantoinase A
VARLGIDVGGTFVDLVLVPDEGEPSFEKVLADPADLVGVIIRGLERLLRTAATAPDAVREVVHATTRGSNTVLERSGPVTALVTTEGFRDVLQIQRSLRWSMYDVQLEKPPPLVPRSLSFEVPERTRADGSVERPLDEDALAAVAAALRERKVEAVAVMFLHSYARPGHERRAGEILAGALPEAVVAFSSELSLQAREYERANTAVVNVYIARAVNEYLEELGRALPRAGVGAPLWVMQSSGGLASIEQASAVPVRTLESGPAAGVLAAAAIGRRCGFPDVISFDMGGTTAKAAVVQAGIPRTTTSFEIERVQNRRGSGLPVDMPALDLVEVGTGGGSIAEVRHGSLRVGPQSAGADPGPACYGRGGASATVTDANLLLGYYESEGFAGGALALDRAAAERAVDALAEVLGVDRTRAAWGVHEVATLDMEHAIRLVSINRGFDPREHAFVCLGGAGPAHGPRLARALGCRVALVPPIASGASAHGLVEASESTELVRSATVRLDDPDAGERCRAVLGELDAEASRGAWAAVGGVDRRRSVGLRYVGQGHEVVVRPTGDPGDPAVLSSAFHRTYADAYGYAMPELPVEAVSWHLTLVRPRTATHASVLASREASGPSAPARRRAVFFPETGVTEVDVHDRRGLRPGDMLVGPCLVAEPTTTTVVLPADRVEVAVDGTLVITIGGVQ